MDNKIENPFALPEFDIHEYWKKNRIVGHYGVPYLDRELLGIAKTDLVLIGSRAGSGKSTLARLIYNTNDKKKTALFSLENYDGDVQMALSRKLYNETYGTKFDSRRWQTGYGLNINEDALNKVINQTNESIECSFLFGRNAPNDDPEKRAWTIKTLTEKIIWCATHGVELTIIDHLDYLDRDDPNESDNTHVTELMKAIRTAQELGSAIVAISHLRKPMGNVENLIVPNENEFIGSSNKVKQATQVIMFAPANEGDAENGYGTWCCIRKNRNGGIKNQAAKLFFMPATETYKPEYLVYTVNYAGTKVSQEPVETVGVYPYTADNGKIKFAEF